MQKSNNKLAEISVAFAVEILNLVKYLKNQHETIICNQIGRAGTSIDANSHEAQFDDGYSDDYVDDGLDGTDDYLGDGLDGDDEDYDDDPGW